jgi:hypothetical protein
MKKTLALLLTIALAASIAGPAGAAKKKKSKGPKPYKSEEVTIEFGHTIQYGNTETVVGITGQEFINTCAIPGSNGLDAYVWEVPDTYKNVDAVITALGSGGSAGYDLDIVLFDESCAITLASQSTSADETTIMAKGTAFILIYNFGSPSSPVGGSDAATARFELKPYTL